MGHTLDSVLHALLAQVRLELAYEVRLHDRVDLAALGQRAVRIVRDFAQSLPAIRELLDSDVVAAFEGDPAAHSVDEVLLCYPGVLAMIHHRLAHRLYELGVPLLARVLAEGFGGAIVQWQQVLVALGLVSVAVGAFDAHLGGVGSIQ